MSGQDWRSLIGLQRLLDRLPPMAAGNVSSASMNGHRGSDIMKAWQTAREHDRKLRPRLRMTGAAAEQTSGVVVSDWKSARLAPTKKLCRKLFNLGQSAAAPGGDTPVTDP